MSVKVFNISVPKKYDQNGEEKTSWNNVGRVVIFEDGGMKVEIPAIGLDAPAFPPKDRDAKPAQDTSAENIPF